MTHAEQGWIIMNFLELKIDGAFISELVATPSQTVRTKLFYGPRQQSEQQVVREYY